MVDVVSPRDILVDVIVLSRKLCKFPIQGKLAYATSENFLGRIVDGYDFDANDVILLTKQVAQLLCQVQTKLNKNNLGLYIYDAYRPLRAVRDFAQWFHQPPASEYELKRKEIHFPNINKTDLVSRGYAPALISRHNFGNTVDLTLINIETQQELDMGACFDYFDELSHNTASPDDINYHAYNNRILLTNIMQEFNFIPYEKEFWHFEHQICEVDKPMDLPIDKTLRGLNVDHYYSKPSLTTEY